MSGVRRLVCVVCALSLGLLVGCGGSSSDPKENNDGDGFQPAEFSGCVGEGIAKPGVGTLDLGFVEGGTTDGYPNDARLATGAGATWIVSGNQGEVLIHRIRCGETSPELFTTIGRNDGNLGRFNAQPVVVGGRIYGIWWDRAGGGVYKVLSIDAQTKEVREELRTEHRKESFTALAARGNEVWLIGFVFDGDSPLAENSNNASFVRRRSPDGTWKDMGAVDGSVTASPVLRIDPVTGDVYVLAPMTVDKQGVMGAEMFRYDFGSGKFVSDSWNRAMTWSYMVGDGILASGGRVVFASNKNVVLKDDDGRWKSFARIPSGAEPFAYSENNYLFAFLDGPRGPKMTYLEVNGVAGKPLEETPLDRPDWVRAGVAIGKGYLDVAYQKNSEGPDQRVTVEVIRYVAGVDYPR